MTRLPTTDLYFLNTMAPWVRARFGLRKKPIRAIGANAFIAGEWFVLVRRDTPQLMREALAWRGKLAYVIDDDVAAGMQCPLLPTPYRMKLAEFDRQFHRDLLARADVILAASDALAQSLARNHTLGGPIKRIDPVWRQPFADTAHFAAVERGAPLRIVQLGSASHRETLRAIAPIMRDILERDDRITYTYFSPQRIDERLEQHSRARRIEPMTWREYQRWIGRNRFHLALYPLAQTAFDRARSASKLTEHAILGAAGIYAEGWHPARICKGTLLAPDRPEEWGEMISQAISQRHELQLVAETFNNSQACVQPCAVQQGLWKGILSIEQC